MLQKVVIALVFLSFYSGASENIGNIYVYSAKMGASVQDLPASIGVIGEKEISDQAPSSVQDLFAATPGVHAALGPRPSAEQINIRGIDSTKIFFTIDGARQNFRGSHDADFLLNLKLLKTVEVIKGPASTLYGSGAVGGVVSFETKSASDFLEGDEKFGAALQASYHSANTKRSIFLTTYGRAEFGDALFSVSFDEANSLRLGDGEKLPYSESEGRDFFIKLKTPKKSLHQIQVSAQKMLTKAQEPQNGRTSVSSRNPLTNRESTKDNITLRYKMNVEGKTFIDPHATLHYTKTNVEKFDLSINKLARTSVKTIGLDLYNISKLFENNSFSHELTYGAEFVRDDNEGRNGGDKYAPFPDGKSEFYGTYLQYKFHFLQKYNLVTGLRYDEFNLSSKDQNLEKEGDQFTKKIALSAQLISGVTFFTNYGEGYNAPRLQDLFVNGLHFPGSGPIPNNYFVANPNLVPEQTKSYEIGLKSAYDDLLINEDSIFLELVFFKTEASNFIEQVVNTTGGTTTFENRANVDFKGIETKIQYDFEQSSFSFSYAQTRSKNRLTGLSLDTTAADEWHLMASHLLARWDLKLLYHGMLAEDQNRVATSSKKSKGYNIHNVAAIWAPQTGRFSKAEISLYANNVFDRDYRPHTALLKSSGRDFYLDFKYRF